MKQQLLKIKVLSKKKTITTKDGKERTIRDYFTPCKIKVKGEEEKGKQEKYLTVKMTQKVELPKNCNYFVAIVDVAKGHVSIPNIWEVKTNEKTGKIEYPTLWIRGYEKIEILQPKINVDVEFDTDDEDDAEETELDESVETDLPFAE